MSTIESPWPCHSFIGVVWNEKNGRNRNSGKLLFLEPNLVFCSLPSTVWLTIGRIYVIDGIYQSVICFFMGFLLFAPATFVTESGRSVADRSRMGIYVACATIAVVNIYVLLNMYRWDWITVLVVAISTVLVWFWTGVFSSFSASFQFYQSAAQVYGTLAFWAVTLLIIVVCLLPRFSAKFIQKTFFPLDIDIVREQVRLGMWKEVEDSPPAAAKKGASSSTSSEMIETNKDAQRHTASIPDSERPLYPPSEVTTKTLDPQSQDGSEDTHRSKPSLDLLRASCGRPALEPIRSSYERSRQSMDRLRPSFEGSRDLTSAALLSRVESSHSHSHASPCVGPSSARSQDVTSSLR